MESDTVVDFLTYPHELPHPDPHRSQKPKSASFRHQANTFIPGAAIHLTTTTNMALNPLARIFSPGWTRSLSKLNVYAKAFIPSGVTVPGSNSAELESKQEQDIKANSVPSGSELPVSSTRLFAESGQLICKSKTLSHILPPSLFPVENGLKPTSTPSDGPALYNGALESQKQKFKVNQNNKRELSCNWKGTILCANGEEMPSDPEEMSDDAHFAEVISQPPFIHHFNWMGEGVHFTSITPSAVSLVVIMSLLKPRGLMYGPHVKDLRRSVIFRNALKTVDPVYFYGDNPDVLSGFKGTALQEKVIGCVAKVYSGNGYWQDSQLEDYDESEEVPEVDPLDENYYDPEDVMLNGWYQNHDLPTWRSFVELDTYANKKDALTRKLSVVDRLPFTPCKSRLIEVVSAQEVEVLDEDKTNPDDIAIPSLTLRHGSTEIVAGITPSVDLALFAETLVNWADEADNPENWPELPPIEPINQKILGCSPDQVFDCDTFELDSEMSVRSDLSMCGDDSEGVVTPETVPVDFNTLDTIPAITACRHLSSLSDDWNSQHNKPGEQVDIITVAGSDIDLTHYTPERPVHNTYTRLENEEPASINQIATPTLIRTREIEFFKDSPQSTPPSSSWSQVTQNKSTYDLNKTSFESDLQWIDHDLVLPLNRFSPKPLANQRRVNFADAPIKSSDLTISGGGKVSNIFSNQGSDVRSTPTTFSDDILSPVPALPTFSRISAKNGKKENTSGGVVREGKKIKKPRLTRFANKVKGWLKKEINVLN